jgi:hypothetical protein
MESFQGKSIARFENLLMNRGIAATWMEDYIHHSPHGSPGYITPPEVADGYVASAPASATPQPALQRS